jgi:hypothetical protein
MSDHKFIKPFWTIVVTSLGENFRIFPNWPCVSNRIAGKSEINSLSLLLFLKQARQHIVIYAGFTTYRYIFMQSLKWKFEFTLDLLFYYINLAKLFSLNVPVNSSSCVPQIYEILLGIMFYILNSPHDEHRSPTQYQ